MNGLSPLFNSICNVAHRDAGGGSRPQDQKPEYGALATFTLLAREPDVRNPYVAGA